MIGTVVKVSTSPAGAETAASAAAGATVLTVVDAFDLAETGGTLLIDGAEATYLAADHAADTVTLAEPLTADLEAGTLLLVSPPAPVTTATVTVEDDDGTMTTVEALVPASLLPSLPTGMRDGTDPETVTLDVVAGTLTVVDLPDREPLEVWGDPQGRHVQIGEDALSIWDVEVPDEAAEPVLFRSTLLGGPGDDQLLLSRADGTTYGLDAEGRFMATGGDFAGDIRVGGVPLIGTRLEGGDGEVGWLDSAPVGVTAWRQFDQTSAERATGEEWGYASIRATLRAGRLYRVTAFAEALTGNTGGVVNYRLRYTTDGSAVRVDSPILALDTTPEAPSATWPMPGDMTGVIGYDADTDLAVLLCYRGTSNATPKMTGATILIEDCGPVLGYAAGGYSTGGATAGSSTVTTPPQVTREYTSTWKVTSWRAYYGNGNERSSGGELVQGYTPYYPDGGINRSAVLFNGGAEYSTVPGEVGKTMGTALTDATITRTEVILTNRHWHSSSGGRALFGSHPGTSLPATLPSVDPTATRPSTGLWPVGARRWERVPNATFGPSDRILTIGGGSSTSTTYYGRFAATDVYARITYTR